MSTGAVNLNVLQEAQSLLMRGRTCICGFKQCELRRQFSALWVLTRNLYSAYQHEFNEGNSRLDLLPVLSIRSGFTSRRNQLASARWQTIVPG